MACGAPLAAVGVNSPLPLDSRCSGEVTVTSLIWPRVRLPALTLPSGLMLTSLGETPAGSLIGGTSGLPWELTIAPLASTPKVPSRVSATLPLEAVTSK